MKFTRKKRDADFLAAYFLAVREWPATDPAPVTNAVIRKVLQGAAPAFYIGYEQAYRRICNPGHYIPENPRTLREHMWVDLYKTVMSYQTSHPGMSLSDAVMHVLEHVSAPSFYLTFHSARSIFFKARRKRRLDRPRR